MKILKKDGNYRKVSNDFIANNLVKTMGWEYSTRSEWKENVRDVKKVKKQTPEIITKDVVSDKKETKKYKVKRK
jgi:hypothetical protein